MPRHQPQHLAQRGQPGLGAVGIQHAIDSGLPTVALLPADRTLRYANGGDEHGLLYADAPDARLPSLGHMLWLIPGHCDPTVNLYDFLIGVRGGLMDGVVERIIRVDARGALT